MRRHSSGQARVTLGGKVHYLGRWGSPESHQRYGELVRQFLDGGRRPLERAPTVVEAAFTVADLLRGYRGWVEASGRYRKGGEWTSTWDFLGGVMDSFEDFAGAVVVRNLGESVLVRWRDRLETDTKVLRTTINRKVAAVLKILRWGRARGLVSREVWADASAIVPLRRGECGSRPERRPDRMVPTFDQIEKVASIAPRQIGAMLRLQALTGCRPAEVCQIRWADIDKDGPDGTWVYTVAAPKTQHHGHLTRYVLCTEARSILTQQPPTLPATHVFSPTSHMAERRIRLREDRKCPITKQTRERDATPKRELSPYWTTSAYRAAVEAACAKAGVPRFTPHLVRHRVASYLAENLGVLSASAALNHRSPTITARYLHPDADAGLKAAQAMQLRVIGS